MKYGFFTVLISLVVSFASFGQDKQILPPGYPDRSASLDVLPGFVSPPKGYGEVSFYWWVGDTLTKERITSQLDQLKDKSITGLQINYCHTDKGGASYGLSYPSKPALFSAQWWELFQWFLKEAKKRDMSVSLSDYTLGAAGQGWFVDEMLNENPQLHGSKLVAKQFDVTGLKDFKTEIPAEVIAAVAYQIQDGKLQTTGQIDLQPFILNSELNWKAPSGNWKVIVVYKTTVKTSFDPMNPLSGPKTIEKFYQRFEDHCPGEAGKGLNFFFSDELQFGIRGFLWNDRFASEFKKRKGYDVLPELPSLFADLGSRSYKIRLDYNDVLVSLSEECFFKPLYNWHTDRGMLFGCDHGGRGTDVTEFGDYFRTQRWMSGPGNDQPGLGRDIIKNKVASSIAHLYERPRTWLEGFYGSGWGTSSEEVADATFANFAMGQNLLSLHGLYYTTHGGWWEWAAPDNHWRQPYWANMGDFLKCSERLSYVLSQGHHRCDVAMIYPVAPTEANLKGKESTETAFKIARDLYPAGIDFDFMDFESLDRCLIQNSALNVSGEIYKVLVLPAMSAVRYSTIEKALDFYRSGGIVLAVGALPEASDRIGGDDKQLQAMIREMFGTTCLEKQDPSKVYSQKSTAGGTGIFISEPLDVKKLIDSLIQPDFKVLSGSIPSYILHRKVGNRDLYFVYGLPKGTSCFFRSSGKVELWDPYSGNVKPLQVSAVSENGTTMVLPLEKNEPQLIVFSPGKPEMETKIDTEKTEVLEFDGNWEFELKPTLDNKFGDYRLPAFDGMVGVDVVKMDFSEEKPGMNAVDQLRNLKDLPWKEAEVSYGPQFWKLGPLPSDADFTALEAKLKALKQVDASQPIDLNGKSYYWTLYEFSWRWGLKDDVGHQGYHGLKGIVNNELISFGIINKSSKQAPVYRLAAEPEGTIYYLWSTVVSPSQQQVQIKKDGLLPVSAWVNQKVLESEKLELKAGANDLLLKFKGVGRGYFVFKQKTTEPEFEKQVSLATDWSLNPAVLPFDCNPKQNKQYGWYRFEAPPGALTMYIPSVSKPEVWVSGVKMGCQTGQLQSDRLADKNLPVWKINFPKGTLASTTVAVRLEQKAGFYGGAAIPEPIVFECGKGTIQMGDLQDNASLKMYSGGMWYRKTVNLNAEQVHSRLVVLDLGNVVASAEVFVNGTSVGSKTSSPWNFDVTDKLNTGLNRIEILVYNTLGNHYLSTPSQYIGRTNSGLIGPVRLLFQDSSVVEKHLRMLYGDTTRLGLPFAKDPYVIRFKGRYLMYYSIPGFTDKTGKSKGWGVGIAQSKNLTDWTRIGEVNTDPTALYEAKGFAAPCALVIGNKVHLFYQTYGNGPKDAICHAWSSDGIQFTRDQTNPIFRPSGDWTCGRAIDAEVVAFKGNYYLYYATRDPNYKIQMQGVAVAPGNTTFERKDWKNLSTEGPMMKPELPWEGDCIEAASVIEKEGALYLFYGGAYNNAPQQIGLAKSSDGVHWERLSNKPFLANGKPVEWNSSESGHPHIFANPKGPDYLFFQGNDSKGKTWLLSNVKIGWKDKMPFIR